MWLYLFGGDTLDRKVQINSKTSSFEGCVDEEIVMEAKAGNSRAQEYIIGKYENFVKAKAKSYF